MQKIMFNDRYGLTQAVLNGTKTMTRRLIKDVNIIQALNELADIEIIKEKVARYKRGEVVAVAQSYYDVYAERQVNGSFYEWCKIHHLDHKKEIHDMEELQKKNGEGWTNKMFVKPSLMPHQIQITGIKIERLQDITDEDCLKEGVIQQAHPFVREAKDVYVCPNLEGYYTHPRGCFADLINRPSVGRKGLWEENPWVICYSFKLVK